MNTRNLFLPSYSAGPGCYRDIPWVTRHFGRRAVVIGGKTAMQKSRDALLAGCAGGPELSGFLWYGGNSSYENVGMLSQNPLVLEADMIFAVGGGRALDTCKILAERLDKPLFTFPTIASNCAACTTICVVYGPDDAFLEYFFCRRPAIHTFIDTRIIAEAPESFLWAGIGDALSKEFECLFSSRAKPLDHAGLIGTQLSRICTEPLLAYGAEALDDCHQNRATHALTEVALDIIVSTGLVSNSVITRDHNYNSSLAHCIYYGSTVIPAAAGHLHGEIVAYGVLILLTCDGQKEARDRIYRFLKSVGLPTCLHDLGMTEEDLPALIKKALATDDIHFSPYEITREMIEEAVLSMEAYSAAHELPALQSQMPWLPNRTRITA